MTVPSLLTSACNSGAWKAEAGDQEFKVRLLKVLKASLD